MGYSLTTFKSHQILLELIWGELDPQEMEFTILNPRFDVRMTWGFDVISVIDCEADLNRLSPDAIARVLEADRIMFYPPERPACRTKFAGVCAPGINQLLLTYATTLSEYMNSGKEESNVFDDLEQAIRWLGRSESILPELRHDLNAICRDTSIGS